VSDKRQSPSVVTPTDRELGWWLVSQVVGKLMKLALLAAIVYGAWWWWTHR
jgi:hypothetical protein